MLATNLQIKKGIDLRELQVKFLHNRVVFTEKTIAELCRVLTGYTFNCARLRDSSDQVSQALDNISESETISKSLSQGLKQFSRVMSQLGDIRDTEVKVLEEQVLDKLATYEDKCKFAKTEVSNIMGAFSKEATRRKELERVRQKNSTKPNTQAETDYAKAHADVTRKLKIVEETIQVFEEQKIKDLKTTLLIFIKGEIRAHAKALEMLTQGYRSIEDVSEQEDLQNFLDTLYEPDNLQRLETVKKTTTSNTSLNTIAGLFSKSPPTEHVSDGVLSPDQETRDSVNIVNTQDIDDDDVSPTKTCSSKSQPSGLVQKIKALTT